MKVLTVIAQVVLLLYGYMARHLDQGTLNPIRHAAYRAAWVSTWAVWKVAYRLTLPAAF